MATTVAQRSRSKGWRKPAGSVCVDRTSRWGNPFKVGDRCADGMTRTAEGAVFLFRIWATTSGDPRAQWIRDHVHELRGKTLLCWCPQPGPCHAHVLAEMADSSGELDR